jgi:hypothetical protein
MSLHHHLPTKKEMKIMKTITILIVLIFVFLSFGCIGNNTESKNVSAGDAVPPIKTLADNESGSNVVTPTPNVTPTSTQLVYQDAAWGLYIQRCAPLISTDFTNAGSAADNLDYTTLGINGQNIVDDTQKALDENGQYNVSPKYQDAQNEWELALQDYNSAGKYMILVADDGKIGKTNSENVKNVTSLCSSGAGHVNRATALMQAEAGTT